LKSVATQTKPADAGFEIKYSSLDYIV